MYGPLFRNFNTHVLCCKRDANYCKHVTFTIIRYLPIKRDATLKVFRSINKWSAMRQNYVGVLNFICTTVPEAGKCFTIIEIIKKKWLQSVSNPYGQCGLMVLDKRTRPLSHGNLLHNLVQWYIIIITSGAEITAHLRTKCSWWAFVIAAMSVMHHPSCVVHNFFKYLLLLTHLANLDETWQGCSLGEALPKLFKRLNSNHNSGCHGNQNEKSSKIFENLLLWN